MMTSSIPARFHAEICARHRAGESPLSIVQVLRKHRVSTSPASVRRLINSEAKRAAEAAAGRRAKSEATGSIEGVPVRDELLEELDEHLRLLKGRLQHAAGQGSTNEHVRSLGAFFDLLERRQKIKREEAGPVSYFRDLPELLTAASRNDLQLRQRDAAAWLGVHLPTIVSMLDDAADALERVEDLRKPFGGDLLTHCARVRAALERLDAGAKAAVVVALDEGEKAAS